MTKTTDTPKCFCLACGHDFECATGIDRGPRPGDCSLCLECGHVMIFDEGLRVRNPTSEEMDIFMSDFRVLAARATIRARNALQRRDRKVLQ